MTSLCRFDLRHLAQQSLRPIRLPRGQGNVSPEGLRDPGDEGNSIETIWAFGSDHIRLDTHRVSHWVTE